MFLQALKNVAQTIFPSIQSSGNITITNNGSSTNNKTYINVQINNANISSNNSQIIEELEDQKDVIPAVTEDEINCLPLSSEALYLEFRSSFQIFPKLTHNYQTVIIIGFKCKSLEPEKRQRFQQLSQTLIHLKFFDCEFDDITLCDILCQLPLLESLELSMKLTINPTIEPTEDKLPKLLHFKDFKMEINENMVKCILDIISNASNMEFLTLFDAIFDTKDFIYYLDK